jgi:hypothetical protein
VEGSCERSNERSVSTNCWEVLECSCVIGDFSIRAQLNEVSS